MYGGGNGSYGSNATSSQAGQLVSSISKVINKVADEQQQHNAVLSFRSMLGGASPVMQQGGAGLLGGLGGAGGSHPGSWWHCWDRRRRCGNLRTGLVIMHLASTAFRLVRSFRRCCRDARFIRIVLPDFLFTRCPCQSGRTLHTMPCRFRRY